MTTHTSECYRLTDREHLRWFGLALSSGKLTAEEKRFMAYAAGSEDAKELRERLRPQLDLFMKESKKALDAMEAEPARRGLKVGSWRKA